MLQSIFLKKCVGEEIKGGLNCKNCAKSHIFAKCLNSHKRKAFTLRTLSCLIHTHCFVARSPPPARCPPGYISLAVTGQISFVNCLSEVLNLLLVLEAVRKVSFSIVYPFWWIMQALRDISNTRNFVYKNSIWITYLLSVSSISKVFKNWES